MVQGNTTRSMNNLVCSPRDSKTRNRNSPQRFSCPSSSTTGGGPSTLKLTTASPRRITRPSDRFISCGAVSSSAGSPALFLAFTRRISWQWASTTFICRSNASIYPTSARTPFSVTLSRQLMSDAFRFWGGLESFPDHILFQDTIRDWKINLYSPWNQ